MSRRGVIGRLLSRATNSAGDQPEEGGYSRVPSHGTISASNTSTSLVTDFDPNRHIQVLEYPPADQDSEDEEDEENEDFEKTRLHFQKQKQISVKSKHSMEMELKGGASNGSNRSENLRSIVPFVKKLSTDSVKIKEEYAINGEVYERPQINFMSQLLAALAVSLGSLMVGFTTAYTSPALATMYNSTSISVTKDQGSWIGGLMPLAAMVGGLLGGFLIIRLGRRNTILSTAVPFIISWIIIASSPNVYVVYAGRALGGLCVGIGSLAFPVYLGETLQPEVRGQLGLLPTALGNVGILICFVAGKYMDWSILAYFGALIPIPYLVLMFLIPETPRWYVSRGDNKGARDSLRWLRGKRVDVDNELNEIVDSHEQAIQNDSGTSIFDLFNKENYRAVCTSLGMMFFQQMSGINAVIFYTVSIFQSAGSTVDENLSTIIVGIVNFVSTFIATFLIDRLGRKILMYISSTAMIVTLGALGAFFYVKSLDLDVSSFGWIPLVSFVVYVVGFSIGMGPIPWLMMGEILPARIRGPAASTVTTFNWTCTFIVTKTFNDVLELIGESGTFWAFGAICVVGLFFTIFFVPETKGKSLEEIERKLNGGK